MKAGGAPLIGRQRVRGSSDSLFFMTTTSTAQLINNVSDKLERIEATLADMSSRIHGLEIREAGCNPMMGAKVDSAHRRIDALETQIRSDSATVTTLRSDITELKHTARILSWLGGLLASTLIIWILGNVLELL